MAIESPLTGVTLRSVGEALGISHVTVSLALRGDTRISAARRKQVQDKAVEMGYRANPMAAALGQLRFATKARQVTSELAWINYQEKAGPQQRYKEFDSYWAGALQTANWFGYNLEKFVCNADFTLGRLEKVLLARSMRGILIPPHTSLPKNWDSFGWDQFCVVRFGHSIQRPRVHVVTSDQITNSLLAFSKVQSRGYRRIGFANSETSSTRYKAGILLAQSHLDPKDQVPPFVFHSGISGTDHQKEWARWLKKTKPDAILTDVAAVPEMLKQAGYEIPKDIGLAVFSVLDGNADAGIFQNPEEIGKAAVEMLISLINHNHRGIPKICRELLIEGEWVDGTSLPTRAG